MKSSDWYEGQRGGRYTADEGVPGMRSMSENKRTVKGKTLAVSVSQCARVTPKLCSQPAATFNPGCKALTPPTVRKVTLEFFALPVCYINRAGNCQKNDVKPVLGLT